MKKIQLVEDLNVPGVEIMDLFPGLKAIKDIANSEIAHVANAISSLSDKESWLHK